MAGLVPAIHAVPMEQAWRSSAKPIHMTFFQSPRPQSGVSVGCAGAPAAACCSSAAFFFSLA